VLAAYGVKGLEHEGPRQRGLWLQGERGRGRAAPGSQASRGAVWGGSREGRRRRACLTPPARSPATAPSLPLHTASAPNLQHLARAGAVPQHLQLGPRAQRVGRVDHDLACGVCGGGDGCARLLECPAPRRAQLRRAAARPHSSARAPERRPRPARAPDRAGPPSAPGPSERASARAAAGVQKPGRASTMTSAHDDTSATGPTADPSSGRAPGSRLPYRTAWRARARRRPSVVPTLPGPTTPTRSAMAAQRGAGAAARGGAVRAGPPAAASGRWE
jgi:hypothetical protein